MFKVAPGSTVTYPKSFALKGDDNSAAIVVPVLTFKLALNLEPVLGFTVTLF